MDKIPYRGQIYYADLPRAQSYVQYGKRPVIIVSNNIGNEHSNIVLIVPITSKAKKLLPTHFDIELPKIYGTVLCEQIQAVHKGCIGNYAGCLTRNYMKLLDNALSVALNLDGKWGNRLPPEEDELIQKQFKKVEEVRSRYLEEIDLLQKMRGYSENKIEQLGIDSVEHSPENKRKYKKRTKEEIEQFIKEWENSHNKKIEVASAFGFSSASVAQNFYKRHKGD